MGYPRLTFGTLHPNQSIHAMRKSFQPSTRYYFLAIGLGLLVLFTGMRGYAMLASALAQPLLPFSFVLMTITPFLLLSRTDRKVIGIKKPTSGKSYVTATVVGCMAAFTCYVIGILLFQATPDNWYVTIKTFYQNNPAYDHSAPIWQSFLIFTVPAIIFSPVGEELFFRGYFQESLKLNFSERSSTLIECTSFGLIHIFHHGLVNINGNICFFPLSGFIWTALMAGVAFLFVQIRNRSNSIYPVIVSHASFNLSMNAIIFFLI